MDDAPNQIDPTSQNGATEVYITSVQKDKVNAFVEWLKKLRQLEATFPGFEKVNVQVSKNPQEEHWITFLQFDSESNLENWLNSPERQTLLKEANAYINAQEKYKLLSSFGNWFNDNPSADVPPVWMQSMLILLTLYPAVVLETRYILPLMSSINPVIMRFLGVIIIVCSISWVLMPLSIFALGWWLSAKTTAKKCLGAGIVFCLYALEIIFFLITS